MDVFENTQFDNQPFEDRVSYTTALSLKKKGYNHGCDLFYGPRIYNKQTGESLGSDEEYELKAEGHEDLIAIEYGGRIYHDYNKNDCDWLSDKDASCPHLIDVHDWLIKTQGIFIVIDYSYETGMFYIKRICNIKRKSDMVLYNEISLATFDSYFKALSAGIDYILL